MRDRIQPFPAALAACAVAAALSALLPFEPLFDPWAWLVWARELAGLDLDTSAGPSWKPLPVLTLAPFSPFGDAAPDLWLAIVRAAWLALPVLAWRLAARLEGSGGRRAAAAGALAALGVVLIADDITPWARQAAGGLSEPLLAALALGAIDAGLSGRRRAALWLALAAALIRPEAWPFALLYAWREVKVGRVAAGPVLAGALAVAALWLGPDLIGAGNALEGADRARGADNSPLKVLGWALVMPLAALWAGALALVALDRRGRPGAPGPALAAGAGAWILLVAAMAAFGYAGLPRFMAPAIAVVCVLGGAGIVRAVGAAHGRPALARALGMLALAAVVIPAAMRAADVPGELDTARDDSAVTRELLDLAGARPGAFTACGPLWTSDFLSKPALAWELERPMSEVVTTSSAAPANGTVVIGPRSRVALAALMRREGRSVASSADWDVYATGACRTGHLTAQRGEPRALAVAGVSGARR